MNVLSQFAQARKVIKQTRLQPKELERLVVRAQAYDQQAIDSLCQEYEGMLKRICSKYAIRSILGYEDALQSSYMYFLMVVHAYKDTRFDVLPGLFYLAVLRALYKEIQNTIGYMNAVSYLEEENVNTEALTYEDILVDPTALQELDEVLLQHLIDKLDPIEQRVIRETFFEDKTSDIIAKEMHYGASTIRYYKDKALKRLNYMLLKRR